MRPAGSARQIRTGNLPVNRCVEVQPKSCVVHTTLCVKSGNSKVRFLYDRLANEHLVVEHHGARRIYRRIAAAPPREFEIHVSVAGSIDISPPLVDSTRLPQTQTPAAFRGSPPELVTRNWDPTAYRRPTLRGRGFFQPRHARPTRRAHVDNQQLAFH